LARRLADLKAQGVAMIGVFHHPEDVAHLIDDSVQLSSTALSMNGVGDGVGYDVVE
jgi:alpha-D-ribose 1-methylphosphonate 5-triphosphate synthase subunit PhnL